MEYLLRDYQPSDATAVNAVVQAAFAEFREAYTNWNEFSRGFGTMVSLADASEIIVAESDGNLVGAVAYVGAGKLKRDFFPSEWPIVRMLVVLPSCRGFGIGRALMQECVRRAERDGAELIALHTSPVMKVALPLYLRMGFQLEREVPPICGVPYAVYIKRLRGQDAEARSD